MGEEYRIRKFHSSAFSSLASLASAGYKVSEAADRNARMVLKINKERLKSLGSAAN